MSYCLYFYDIRLIHLLINDITQLEMSIVYSHINAYKVCGCLRASVWGGASHTYAYTHARTRTHARWRIVGLMALFSTLWKRSVSVSIRNNMSTWVLVSKSDVNSDQHKPNPASPVSIQMCHLKIHNCHVVPSIGHRVFNVFFRFLKYQSFSRIWY